MNFRNNSEGGEEGSPLKSETGIALPFPKVAFKKPEGLLYEKCHFIL